MNPNQPIKKSKLIPWIFVIFFSTFIIVDIVYIVIAEKTWRGLAIENGYQKGLKYNKTIEALREQKKLGWKMDIKYQVIKIKNGFLVVNLFDKNNQKIIDANLIANIRRPVQEGKDFSVNLKFNLSTQSYDSAVEFPMIGQWTVEVVARKGDDVYQDFKRWVIN